MRKQIDIEPEGLIEREAATATEDFYFTEDKTTLILQNKQQKTLVKCPENAGRISSAFIDKIIDLWPSRVLAFYYSQRNKLCYVYLIAISAQTSVSGSPRK